MQTRTLIQLLEETLASFKGYVIVDREGKIISITRNYVEFLGYSDPSECIGRMVSEIIPNTKLPEIIETGVADIADIWSLHGGTLIVNRLPLRLNGQIIGAIAYDVFRDMKEVSDFASRYMLKEYDGGLSQNARESWKAKYNIKSLIGISSPLQNIKRQIKLVADADCPVLITGESGTGKELIAHALHNESGRKKETFVRINCASIPETLWESELFGYEDGAFTGAKRGGKLGKFEIADRGTIFLDEIAEMPLSTQAKLLRVLQEMEIERVGSEKLRKIDVRLVAATNQNLEEMVRQKKFREDLYYRLAVFEINIPPLKERREDIPLLVKHMTHMITYLQKTKITGLEPQSISLLKHYDWPGNVRELHNTLERACLVKASGLIDVGTLLSVKPKLIPLAAALSLASEETVQPKGTLKQAEKAAIIDALLFVGGSRKMAAEILGIHRTSLYNKIKELGINIKEVDENINQFSTEESDRI
ncbi:MAG: sigma-54 interaction domain-containing protein [Acidobacteriota bacterium]